MTNRRYLSLALACLVVLAGCSLAFAEPANGPATAPATQYVQAAVLSKQVEAELRPFQSNYQVGQPVWVEFVLRNLTAETLTLSVPNTFVAEMGPPAMGLPLPHVFSGTDFTALQVTREIDSSATTAVSRKPGAAVSPIVLGPYSSVGLHLDASKWYSSLRQPGEYRLQWKPYGGLLASNAVVVKVQNWKDAVIHTEYGNMRVRLYYDKAPKTVEHFVELVGQGFYDNKVFHRVVPGYVLQGGSPTGDDTGVLPNNVRLKAEFSGTPFVRGTIAMARAPGDADSASCQFFVALGRLPELDGNHTAFGELIGAESFETLAKLEQTEVTRGAMGEKSQPVKPLRIQTITLENVPRPPAKMLTPGAQPTVSPGLANR